MAAGKQVGQGFLPWDALTPEDLDPEICPLVEALNRTTWARTIFSCAGHPEEPNSVNEGRRQAHVDLLIADLPRWHTYVQLVRKAARGVRITEGSLGPIPDWLAPVLREARRAVPQRGFGGQASAASEAPDESARGPGERCERSEPGPGGSRAAPWHYRRLVFEPVPYDAPAHEIRQTLNTTLTHALTLLQESPP